MTKTLWMVCSVAGEGLVLVWLVLACRSFPTEQWLPFLGCPVVIALGATLRGILAVCEWHGMECPTCRGVGYKVSE